MYRNAQFFLARLYPHTSGEQLNSLLSIDYSYLDGKKVANNGSGASPRMRRKGVMFARKHNFSKMSRTKLDFLNFWLTYLSPGP